MDKEFLEQKAKELRRKILEIVSKANSSHVGSMLSWTDIATFLFYNQIEINKSNCSSNDRDKFILSKGHASLTLYCILCDKDIISDEELYSYCQNNTCLIGHLNHKVKGIDASTGSLGHGLSLATGLALATKIDHSNHKTYCILGDGECQEGSIWESLLFIANNQLENLIIIIDGNNLQGYNYCNQLLPKNRLISLLKSLGLNFYEINGHCFEEIQSTFSKINSSKNNNANIIYAHTIKGKGVSFMENKLEWHYKSPTPDELKIALSELK